MIVSMASGPAACSKRNKTNGLMPAVDID